MRITNCSRLCNFNDPQTIYVLPEDKLPPTNSVDCGLVV